jgi:prolyl 4-hydroxylase
MEVVRYRPGAEFTPHYDFFCPKVYSDVIRRSGQRVATVLVYLNTPPCGGATTFPDAEIEFVPQQGNALLFSYPRAAPDSLTLHAGVPVGSGEKWIGTFFLVDKADDAGQGGVSANEERAS